MDFFLLSISGVRLSCIMALNLVLCDQEVFESIKEGSRANYVKIWEKFVKYCGFDEKSAPNEEQVLNGLRSLDMKKMQLAPISGHTLVC